MLNIHLNIDKPKIDNSILQKQLERFVRATAKLVAEQTKKEILQKFNLRRPWISKGMRYELGESSPNHAEATVYHRDILMKKQGGDTISGHLATPTEFARARFNDRIRQPRYLVNFNGVFEDPRGDLYLRDGERKRKIFTFSETHHYRERLNLQEVALRTRPL